MKPLIAIFFSALVLFTNMSLSVATHYCGGKKITQQVSFGEEILSCGMVEDQQDLCETSPPPDSIQQVPCCEDKQVFWDVEDRYNPESVYNGNIFLHLLFRDIPAHFEIRATYINLIFEIPDSPGISLLILNQVFRL